MKKYYESKQIWFVHNLPLCPPCSETAPLGLICRKMSNLRVASCVKPLGRLQMGGLHKFRVPQHSLTWIWTIQELLCVSSNLMQSFISILLTWQNRRSRAIFGCLGISEDKILKFRISEWISSHVWTIHNLLLIIPPGKVSIIPWFAARQAKCHARVRSSPASA